MKRGMTIQELLTEVVRMNESKVDYVADTKETIRMVPMPEFEERDADDHLIRPGVALVLMQQRDTTPPQIVHPDGSISPPALQRFRITDNCHAQIAARLKVPKPYYDRLLNDHTDLVMTNVNTLFEREPALRMIRTLDGRARAFLSNSYRRVDNAQVLEQTLPVIHDEYPTRLLSTFVDEDRMRVKCLFTGDDHQFQVGETHDGKPDMIRAGFEMGNSEVGKGSFYTRGFFYRSYCDNGCVFGKKDTTNMRIVHVGSAQGVPDNFVLSEQTQRKEDDVIISATRDVLRHLADPKTIGQMTQRFREMAGLAPVENPQAAVQVVCKEVGMTETESNSVLESFIRDQDYSQWGMVNAVTQVANSDDVDYNRASQIEEMGAQLIDMDLKRWHQIAKVAA